MNKLETEFKTYYEATTGKKLVVQALRFRLGNGLWYKPDFICFCGLGSVLAIEVKGPHAFRGGFENLKAAATCYPQIVWELVWKDGHQWCGQTVLP